jgi:SAM-dependent methyltransferase
MTLARSWQFLGSTKSATYRYFDWLRCRLNERLVRRLLSSMEAGSAGASPFLDASVPRLGKGGGCDVQSPRRVLEAGSGPGFATSLFAKQPDVNVAVCIDFDIAALQEGRRRDTGLLAVVADMRALPFAGESFSLVFNSSTLEHLDEPAVALSEMTRVCDPQGRVFVGVPYLYGPLGFEPLVRRTTVGKWLGPVFDRKSLETLFAQAGLRPLHAFRYFWNFFIGVVAIPDSPCATRRAGP